MQMVPADFFCGSNGFFKDF